MAVYMKDITDTMIAILREEWFSSAYPQSLMELYANMAQQDIVGGRVIHPTTGEEAQAWDLHFLNTDVYYNNVKQTSLTNPCIIWDTILYADTTDYPVSGNLYIWGQVVSYSGITTTSFTWVSGIKYPYIAGTYISICFALPDDFSDVKNVIYNNKFKLPAKPFDRMFEDLGDYKGSNTQRNLVNSIYENQYQVPPFYTIIDAAYLVVFQLNETGKAIHLRYEKLWQDMTDVIPSVIDNDIYAKICISHLAVAEMMYERWEEQRAAAIYMNAIKNVRKMYSWYNDTTYEDQNGTHIFVGKGKRNI